MKNALTGIVIVAAMLCAPALSFAQNSGNAKAAAAADAQMEMPAATPVTTPAELAAKVPKPKAEDVSSAEGILHAAYESISGPAGPRNWDRFRSLCLPQARLTEVGKDDGGAVFVISWSVDEFIRDASAVFAKQNFYENALVNKPEGYGNMLTILSSYESRNARDEKPFQRGVNSFQVLNDGKRWWIVSIFWDSERPDNPLPAKFEKKQ